MAHRVYPTDSGLTHLLHDLSPDGGTYPTMLFFKLLAVTRETKVTLKAKFHYASWFEAGSKLVADRFEAKYNYAIWFEAGRRPASNQLRTSSEPAPNQLRIS